MTRSEEQTGPQVNVLSFQSIIHSKMMEWGCQQEVQGNVGYISTYFRHWMAEIEPI